MGKPKAKARSLDKIAQSRFGYDRLHSGQKLAVEAVLDGHDTLAVMPTGFGKSAIYQLAAFLIPGVTVVVSPLIALQRDQLLAIADKDVGDAAMLNSTIRESDRQETFENLQAIDLFYLLL